MSPALEDPVRDGSETTLTYETKRSETGPTLTKRTVDVTKQNFEQMLHNHFASLPTRYALDVNIEGDDVLMHKALLDSATEAEGKFALNVRPVSVLAHMSSAGGSDASPRQSPIYRGQMSNAIDLPKRDDSKFGESYGGRLSRPAFGSSPSLEALALSETAKRKSMLSLGDEEEGGLSSLPEGQEVAMKTYHEVTVATLDRPKLLSRLSTLMSDIGLNIREAHAFSTSYGYTLDVFVTDGWKSDDLSDLQIALLNRLEEMLNDANVQETLGKPISKTQSDVQEPSVGEVLDDKQTDDWELDKEQLHFISKIAAGSFGDLYRGSYCGQDVAIKILRDANEDSTQLEEFLQEVSIMRKVRHKNIVQFIGACTRKPNLCIVFEYMAGGTVFDYIHRQKDKLKIPTLLKMATDVARGMDYLHKRNIIHRDLKACNLLMDENEVVKIADFGVARVAVSTEGIMTAETGTYRWMAPEVIEHKPYGLKADVFSFGIVLWELLTGKIPYAGMTPLQAAVGVVQKGLRPPIPQGTPSGLAEIMEACWEANPDARPSFSQLYQMLAEVREQVTTNKEKKGLLSRWRAKYK